MKPIHPICEEQCREHYGKPVLVILRDGSELVGVLSRYDQDKLILNGETFPEDLPTYNKSIQLKKHKKLSINQKKKSGGKATVSAFPGAFGPGPGVSPFFPFGGPLVLDLALIALLFALI